MSELKKTIKALIQNKDEKDTSIRINVSMLKHENRRLELVSKLINKPKQSLIEDLFLAALKDLEIELGFRADNIQFENDMRSDTPLQELIEKYRNLSDYLL
ncbi:hypothetical protein [Paenibacillus planticolens]|uniref:Uncharacterized protein n=1 Tax=Paenibacillus planticolens TaxID=2654976 RepID=A0ABX1ZEB2_9BACL|nr:hypothetical protein [Paenibacillus planticolens]NOU98430.1 hypothetical protein [Paenibacillus planticolens]